MEVVEAGDVRLCTWGVGGGQGRCEVGTGRKRTEDKKRGRAWLDSAHVWHWRTACAYVIGCVKRG